MIFKDHNLTSAHDHPGTLYEETPLRTPDGAVVDGLHVVRITLDNPSQLNSYTTDMVKGVILGMRRASNDRGAVAVVFTGTGTRAFCTGGNTAEYAEYYAGHPEEYRQYMRLFNDMVSAILACDKPVICRVNGMRIAGGQEIGMACDFTVASDLANFGQAGPKHGSAPDGGATDFLPLFVGIERSLDSLALCTQWSAYRSLDIGLITDCVPCLKVDGEFIPNPFVVTDRYIDEKGKKVYGEFVTGEARGRAKDLLKRGEVDLAPLDRVVDGMVFKLLMTFPGCTLKTVESVRKHKKAHWDANREQNRAWLGLNMMTEAHAGFRAFNEGPRGNREIDFIDLRLRLARGEKWADGLIDAIQPKVPVEAQR